MKLSTQQENLKKALAQVGRAVPGKPALPILGNILLTAEGERLRLTTTDLNLGITVWIGAQVERSGSVLLPAGLFTDLVAGLPNDRVTLEVSSENQLVTVACARFSTQLNGISAEDFPAVQHTAPEGAASVRFATTTLKEAIPQVVCAAADGDARPVLAGVYLRLHESAAMLAAADGFRLASKQIALPAPVATKQEVIIPAPALRELAGLLSDPSEHITMSLAAGATGSTTATQAIFQTAHWTLATRLIDGQYPDFERILPKGCTTRAILDVRELNRAVRLAALIASVSQNVVKLSVATGESDQAGTVLLSANAAGIGANTGVVEDQVAGEGGQIALNVKYLGEALAVIGTPQVALEMVTAQAPGVLRPVGQNGYVHVIMPMALR
ncbi:DNA polymerase III subunit beta [Roseiflexus sp.]|uniref:DNA polymerase III subunit beta n=1 Tax=Roseiflexus sp. TaxID=2562120 RepID=UPI00398AF107